MRWIGKHGPKTSLVTRRRRIGLRATGARRTWRTCWGTRNESCDATTRRLSRGTRLRHSGRQSMKWLDEYEARYGHIPVIGALRVWLILAAGVCAILALNWILTK